MIDDEFTTNSVHQGSSVRNRRKAKDNKVKKEDSLKIRLFRIFFIVNKERSVDIVSASFLILISFIQIYDLMISTIMKLPFRGSVYNEVATIFDVVRLYPIVYNMKISAFYWFVMVILFVFIILFYFALGLTEFQVRKKQIPNQIIRKYLSYCSTLFFWVLVIPVTDFFISIFECDSKQMLVMDSSMGCWTGIHILYCGLFSFGLLMFIILLILISFLNNESRPYHTDYLRRLDNNQEVYLAIYRIILAVSSHHTTTSQFHWVIISLHIVMSLHLLKNYHKYLPYYNQKISTLYGACTIGYVWVSVNSLLVKALETIDYRGQIIVIVIGFVFLYPTAYFVRKNKIESLVLYKQQDKIKNDLELDNFVVNFQNLIQQSETNEQVEMMLLGFLFMHKEECQSTVCPLKHNDELYLPIEDSSSSRNLFPSKDKILHQHLINSVFLDYAKSHQNTLTTVMHTTYAFFLFFQMGNVHMSLVELNLASRGRISTQYSFTIFKCKQLIEEHLIKKFKQSNNTTSQSYADLDVTIVITFEGLFNRFQRAVEQSATDHIEFWSHLDSNMIDLNVINKLGLNIINQTKRVNEIWAQLKKINPNYPNALYLYGNYMSQIKNDYEQGDEYKIQFHQLKKSKSVDNYENQFEIMFAEDTTIIVMSGNKDSQGKIIKTNQGIFKLFGYNMFEVQGHDVNVLMPPVIAQKHNLFLDKFIKTGKERILNKCRDSFAMYRTGVIFPISLVVKPVPSLKNDIQYIGMLKRSTRDFEYLLTDENGKIDSISDGIISLFKLPISFFKEHEIPIHLIIPELCEVSRQRGSNGEQITNFEAWNGLKQLRFYIPKNLSNSVSRGGMISSNNRQNDNATNDGLSQSGATGTGTGTGTQTQTSSSSKAKNMQLLAATSGQSFVGLRNPESLKSISSMFKNAEHRSQPDKYKNNLLNHVNYNNPDFDKMLKTDIESVEYSDGDLKLKIFKIFFNKKKKTGLGKIKNMDETTSSSIVVKDEDTMMHKAGITGMSALNDSYAFQKYRELILQAKNVNKSLNYKKLQHDIDVLRVLLERQKKVRTYGNIMTPQEYEDAELEKMINHIQMLEQQIQEMNSTGSKALKNGTEKSSQGGYKNPNVAFLQNWGQSFIQGDNDDTSNQESGFTSHLMGALQPNDGKMFNQMANKSNNTSSTPIFIEQGKPQYDIKLDEDSKDEIIEEIKEGEFSSLIHKDDPKASKKKDDPRNKFVKEFFQQNLGEHQYGNNLIVPTTNKKPQIRNDQLKQAYQVDMQNEILRNLHEKKKLDTQNFKSKTDDFSSNPQAMTSKLDENSAPEAQGPGQKDPTPQLQLMKDSSSLKPVDDIGSVASDTKTLMRHLRVLRYALYENYSPQSILNLIYSARFVLMVLIAMTIASFVFSKQKYSQLQNNFYMIQASEKRMQSLTSIISDTRACVLMQKNMMNRNRYNTTSDYFAQMQSDLNAQAIALQYAQTNLSNTEYDFSDSVKDAINQDQIVVYFNTQTELGSNQTVNIWAAVMQVAINAYKVKDLGITQFNQSSLPVWFILQNTMNNILEQVSMSTQGILSDTQILSDSNKKVLMTLLLVASGCLFASILVIMPVVTKVHKDKDKLLSLFLQIDSNDVKEQLKKSKDFFSTFNNDEKHAQINDQGFDFDEEEKKEGEDGEEKKDGKTPSSSEEERKKDEKQLKRFSRKGKKHKKYSTNYIMLILKFLIFIVFLESYFLYQYFQSDKFLQNSLNMIKEAASITDRRFSNFLLYQVYQEIVATNGSAQVLNEKSIVYMEEYIGKFNKDLENFLSIHSSNANIHDSEFNDFFNKLIYQSVCNTIQDKFTAQQIDKCGDYLGGILNKGLYSANLAFWDNMREMMDLYTQSQKTQKMLTDMINSQRIIENEQLNLIYFSAAYNVLMDKLQQSILVSFENRNKEITILFAFYVFIMIVLYFLIWGRFVESMRHSLWVTKSMLAIIPLEVIEKVKAIKEFLMAISRAAMNSIKE